jgi:predicted MFS family arabinose efflux permease
VLAGGWVASHWGFEALFWCATVLALAGTLCAWRMRHAAGALTPRAETSGTG